MPFDLRPVLEGDLVTLGPLSTEDQEILREVASDPLIWEQHPVKTRCEPEGFAEFFQESIDSGGALLVTDLASGEVIGSSRYQGYDESKLTRESRTILTPVVCNCDFPVDSNYALQRPPLPSRQTDTV